MKKHGGKTTPWTNVAFGDVVQLSKERSSDPEADGYERYIGLEHIDPGELRVRRWGDITDGVTFTSVFRPGQVLFGKRRAYQRKVAVAPFSGVCSGDIYVLEPRGDALLPDLLPFICQTDAFLEHAVGTSAGSLSPRTNWKSLADFEFALPPIHEQRRLIKILSFTQTAWVNIGELVESLNELVASLARELMERLEHAGFGAREGIDDLGLKGKPTLKTGPFGTKLRTSYFQEAGRPVITIGSITEGGLDPSELFYLSEERAEEFQDYECVAGDIVISRVADVGRCHLIEEQEAGYIISSNLIRIRVNPDLVRPKYLWLMLRYSDDLRQQIARVTTQAAGRLLVNTKTLSTLDFFLPNLAYQDNLLTQVQTLEHLRTKAVHRKDRLSEFRSRLAAVALWEGNI